LVNLLFWVRWVPPPPANIPPEDPVFDPVVIPGDPMDTSPGSAGVGKRSEDGKSVLRKQVWEEM
jgi:hypothetical protein